MRIDFDDGGYLEVIKSPHDFDKIYIVVATKEGPLRRNVNSACINRLQFEQMAKEVLSIKIKVDKKKGKEKDEHIISHQGDQEKRSDEQHSEGGAEDSTGGGEVDSEKST